MHAVGPVLREAAGRAAVGRRLLRRGPVWRAVAAAERAQRERGADAADDGFGRHSDEDGSAGRRRRPRCRFPGPPSTLGWLRRLRGEG